MTGSIRNYMPIGAAELGPMYRSFYTPNMRKLS